MKNYSFEGIKFDNDGVVSAIIVDEAKLIAGSKDAIRQVGSMTAESLKITQESGLVALWSRSRQEIWRIGSVSGATVSVNSICADRAAENLLVFGEYATPDDGSGDVTQFNEID